MINKVPQYLLYCSLTRLGLFEFLLYEIRFLKCNFNGIKLHLKMQECKNLIFVAPSKMMKGLTMFRDRHEKQL